MKNVHEVYEALIEEYGVNEELLDVITSINGYSIETLNEVIHAMFGYHSLEQLQGEEE